MRWALLAAVLRPFARYMLVCKSAAERRELSAEAREAEAAKDADVEKFCKYGWHMGAYVALWAWGLQIMQREEWSILNARSVAPCWEGYPHPAAEKPALKPFFLAQVPRPALALRRPAG